MAKQSYKETLLPQAGEEKQAYYDRIVGALSQRTGDAKDRAMLLVSKAIATAWKGLDDMTNPFQSVASNDPGTPRENLEVAVVLMADAMKKVVPKLDALKEPKDEIEEAIRTHGGGLGKAAAAAVKGMVTKQIKGSYDQKVKEMLTEVKAPFDELMKMAADMPEHSLEKRIADEMAGVHKDFKAARKQLYPSTPGKK